MKFRVEEYEVKVLECMYHSNEFEGVYNIPLVLDEYDTQESIKRSLMTLLGSPVLDISYTRIK